MLTDSELCTLARNGDGTAMAELFQRHAGIVPSRVKRYWRSFPWADRWDMMQVGYIGMLTAIRLYNPERGNFSYFAFMAVRHAIMAWVERELKYANRFAHFDEFDPPENSVDSCETFDATDAQIEIDRIRNTLPDRWFQALELYYKGGFTLEEVGQQMGVSRERVRQMLRNGVKRANKLAASTN